MLVRDNPVFQKKVGTPMACGATDNSMWHRLVSPGHYLATLVLVGCFHAVVLLTLWMPQPPAAEPAMPLRIMARTLVLPAPKPSPAPTAEPVKTLVAPAKPSEPLEQSKPSKLTTAAQKPAFPKKVVQSEPAVRPAASVTPTSLQKTAVTPLLRPEPAPVIEVPPQFEGVAYLQNPAPAYPMLSRRRREQGTVQLQVWVTTAGKADKVEVLQSSGFTRLDEAALATVKQWRFVPAKRGDVAVDSTVQVPVVFSLK